MIFEGKNHKGIALFWELVLERISQRQGNVLVKVYLFCCVSFKTVKNSKESMGLKLGGKIHFEWDTIPFLLNELTPLNQLLLKSIVKQSIFLLPYILLNILRLFFISFDLQLTIPRMFSSNYL